MSKFEEYDFYAKNKNFLVSNQIITFSDLHGRLMALKPDVTLSIAKNANFTKGTSEKVYYTEKVYRAEKGEFREINQLGLECLGDLGSYDTAEVLILAAQSLRLFADKCTLDLSHMGFLSALLDEARVSSQASALLLKAISEKNAHELKRICEENQVSATSRERLIALTRLYGGVREKLPELRDLSINEETDRALDELEELYHVMELSGLGEVVHLDFSIVNDMNYYNGIIFRGYVEGVPQGVLAGGRYDNILDRPDRHAKALGFAITLDSLELLQKQERTADVDVLITYDDDVPIPDILMAVHHQQMDHNFSTRVQKSGGGSVTANKVIHLSNKVIPLYMKDGEPDDK